MNGRFSRRDMLAQQRLDHTVRPQIYRTLEKALPMAVIQSRPGIWGPLEGLDMKWQHPDFTVLPYPHMGPMFFTVASPASPQHPTRAAIFRQLLDLGYRAAIVRDGSDVLEKLGDWGVWDHASTRRLENSPV